MVCSLRMPYSIVSAVIYGFSSFSAGAEPIQLQLPISCDFVQECVVQQYVDHDSSPGARDYMCGSLSYDGHNGTDFRLLTSEAMRRGVGVVAAAAGSVLRARDDMEDVSVRKATSPVAGRECGNGVVIDHGNGWETQYCHLARGSVAVKSGDHVRVGDRIGLVGLSGQTEFPHLHLTVRFHGKIVDPFAFEAIEGSCGSGVSLWTPVVRDLVSYRSVSVINAGFAAGPVTMETIETGEAGRALPNANAPALVAFVRSIGLSAGDIQQLTLRGPDNAVLAESRPEPLAGNKAQYMMFTGKKRTAASWKAGTYEATYTVIRNGSVIVQKEFKLTL